MVEEGEGKGEGGRGKGEGEGEGEGERRTGKGETDKGEGKGFTLLNSKSHRPTKSPHVTKKKFPHALKVMGFSFFGINPEYLRNGVEGST
jgi:hypothetical protein